MISIILPVVHSTRVAIGVDDTDTRASVVGTGKLARRFETEMTGDGFLGGGWFGSNCWSAMTYRVRHTTARPAL